MTQTYEVLEMPVGLKSIRMNLEELKRFCKVEGLPLFCLKVEEQVQNGVSFSLQKPYRKYFTIKWDWCFWAAEKIMAPEELEGQKGDGRVVIV